MEEIFSNKPHHELHNIHCDIKNYIELLESKLKLCEKLNKEVEVNYLNLQKETETLKSQIRENNKKYEEMLKLKETEIERLKLKNGKSTTNKPYARNKPSLSVDRVRDDSNFLESSDVTEENTGAANCILIKGLHELQLQENRIKNIINLGRHMDIEISDKDIVNTSTEGSYFFRRNNIESVKNLLIVQFRDAEMKVNFLKNKEKLKQHSHLTNIDICDYVSDETRNLYECAKVLESHGYKNIYIRNNSVYVESTLSGKILIKSSKDVANLMTI